MIATRFEASLPEWVEPFLASKLESPLGTVERRMGLVHALADRNYLEGNGGPFAAVVCDPVTGELVSAGVNVVLSSGLSSMHAEVTAVSLAQVAVGGWDLGTLRPGLELAVNWRPCAMCLGAVLWSGVSQLAVAGDGPELEALTGFDEGPVVTDWAAQLERRGLAVQQDVLRDGALATFTAYGEYIGAGDGVVYNASR